MSIQEKENQLINEFGQFEDWADKYLHLIAWGRKFKKMDEQYYQDKYLIQGCQSKVWLHAFLDENNKVILQADSDAEITKGIISLLVWVYSGEDPEDILNSNFEFIEKIGLKEHLSPTRSNGLYSMIKQIKLYALVFKTQIEKKEK